MSIKLMMTPSMLAATLIMFFFHAAEASAADWSEDSKGYTLNCDINDIGYAFGHARGQWKTFEARFSLPADTGAKLWYRCQDGSGTSPMRDPAYDFQCEVKVDQPGASLVVSRVGDQLHIQGMLPGYITPSFACNKVAEAAQVEVSTRGK